MQRRHRIPREAVCPAVRQRSARIVCLDGPRSQTPRRTETPVQSLSVSWHIGHAMSINDMEQSTNHQ
eukprot:3564515-Lingulodinium_polyedra.AAC.1